MRNGLDISGVSELVHEINENPEEAPIVFDVVGQWKRGSALVDVRTAHYGTIRMARGWKVEAEPGQRPAREAPTPEELAIAALGACVLVTHAHGYSARGISLTSLRVGVHGTVRHRDTAEHSHAPRLFEDLRYAIEVECDGDDDQMRALSQFVTCFSPNHRAFLDEGSYTIELETSAGSGPATVTPLSTPPPATLAAAQALGSGRCPVQANLTWEYATQARATMRLGPALNPAERSYDITIDQAKQMVGLDSGLNPQELLLTAIVSELLFGLQDQAERRGITFDALRVESGGRLDIRGMLNVDPSVPARFHRIGLRIVAKTSAPHALVEEAASAAVHENLGLGSLRFPYAIDLELRRNQERLLELRSDGEQVRTFLELMARNNKAHALAKDE